MSFASQLQFNIQNNPVWYILGWVLVTSLVQKTVRKDLKYIYRYQNRKV